MTDDNYTQRLKEHAQTYLNKVLEISKYKWDDEKEQYLMNIAKLPMLGISWDESIYDPVGLQQAVDEREYELRRTELNYNRDYYFSRRLC